MTDMKNFKFYSFTNNRYMSPLQLGLQTAHAAVEMSLLDGEKNKKHYRHWAVHDKTICILQGGNHKMLEDLYEFFKPWSKKHGLALVKFNEDEESLNGACTSVALVVPDKFWAVRREEYLQNNDCYVNSYGDVFRPDELSGEYKYIHALRSAKTV